MDAGVIHVAFCTDANMEVPLHAAAYSLLCSCSHPVAIHLVQSGLEMPRIKLLERTLRAAKMPVELFIVKGETSRFSGLRALHGNYFTYSRLLLPEMLPDVDRVLYLDCDLVVLCDVAELYFRDLNMSGIAAGGIGDMAHALDSAFWSRLGYSPDTPSFNAGVLLMDLDHWRRNGLVDKCLQFARAHPDDLRSADQTVLVGVFAGQFVPLEKRWNHLLHTWSTRVSVPEEAIYHFAGSPKPWDLFGRTLHRNADLFYDVIAHTEFRSYHPLRVNTIRNAQRAFAIKGSLVQSFRRSLRSNADK